jgi:hypothetical protein
VLGPEAYQEIIANGTFDKLRLNSLFGDGSWIEVSDLDHVRAVMQKEMVPVRWQAGDILVVDNMLACHGRMPFSGPRKILLAMA